MNELQPIPIQENIISNLSLWEGMSVVPGVEVKNGKELGKDIKALFTLCPLYEIGQLQDAGLVKFPGAIESSRVAGKWKGIQNVLERLSQYAITKGGSLDLSVVFANKGVLLNVQPRAEDEETLKYHELLYKNEVAIFCQKCGIDFTFLNYDDCNIVFPRFVDPNSPIPATGNSMIDSLNQYMESLGLPNAITSKNKKTRRLLKDISESFGEKAAFWLVAGYLAFDHKIPEMIGENGIYISTERFDPLFRIAGLTKALEVLTRIEVKA